MKYLAGVLALITGLIFFSPPAESQIPGGTVSNPVTILQGGFGRSMAAFTGSPVFTSGVLSAGSFDGANPAGYQLAASAASNNLTISLLNAAGVTPTAAVPATIPIRDVTLANGDSTNVVASGGTTFTINSGNTMGAASGVPFRLWVVEFNNGGVPVIGAIECVVGGASPTQVVALDESSPQSPTGTNGGSTAGTFYGSAALTSKPFRILGYMEWSSGLATAGTWVAPTKIQLMTAGIKKPGDIVQSVYMTTSTPTASTSVYPTFDPSSITASIALSSKANLVNVRTNAVLQAGAAQTYATLRRGTSTNIGIASIYHQTVVTKAVEEALDAPGALSATYTVYISNASAATAAYPSSSWNGPIGAMRLDEIMG